jgi:hypothetical protein
MLKLTLTLKVESNFFLKNINFWVLGSFHSDETLPLLNAQLTLTIKYNPIFCLKISFWFWVVFISDEIFFTRMLN